MKKYYYVGINGENGIIFVSGIDAEHKQALWQATDKPMAFTQTRARDIAEGLCLNAIPAFVVESMIEIMEQPVQVTPKETTIGFEPNVNLNEREPVIVVIEEQVTKEKIDKINAAIQENLETYGQEHDDDYCEWSDRDAVRDVLDALGIKYHMFLSDHTICI